MPADLLLAIDAGGSYVKASLFEPGTAFHTVSASVAVTHPAPGMSEREPEALWQATVGCIRQLLAETDAARVAAVGLTSHGNGLYLVDREGLPTRAAIMAADTRAEPAVKAWRADGVERALRPQAWNGLWAGKPGPLLAWLATHEPETLDASWAVVGCKDYLRARLVGAVCEETSDATAGGLYENASLVNDPAAALDVNAEALAIFGLSRYAWLFPTSIDPLTPFAVSRQAAGETGLPAGTPVIAGLVDNAAMQHGSGVFDSATICVGTGTWSINQLLVPVGDMTLDGVLGAVEPFAASSALGGWGLLSEASATSASTLGWALQQAVTGRAAADRAAERDIFEACLTREAARPRSATDPLFFPFLDGSRDDAAARGAWLGLSSATSEADLLGAVVEGVCFEHRRHVERLEQSLAQRLPVRLSGGATKSPVWCQRFADALARPVQVSPVSELGSVCAAAMAGTSVDFFASVAAGVATLNPTWTTYQPDAATAELTRDRWERYSRFAALLDREAWA